MPVLEAGPTGPPPADTRFESSQLFGPPPKPQLPNNRLDVGTDDAQALFPPIKATPETASSNRDNVGGNTEEPFLQEKTTPVNPAVKDTGLQARISSARDAVIDAIESGGNRIANPKAEKEPKKRLDLSGVGSERLQRQNTVLNKLLEDIRSGRLAVVEDPADAKPGESVSASRVAKVIEAIAEIDDQLGRREVIHGGGKFDKKSEKARLKAKNKLIATRKAEFEKITAQDRRFLSSSDRDLLENMQLDGKIAHDYRALTNRKTQKKSIIANPAIHLVEDAAAQARRERLDKGMAKAKDYTTEVKAKAQEAREKMKAQADEAEQKRRDDLAEARAKAKEFADAKFKEALDAKIPRESGGVEALTKLELKRAAEIVKTAEVVFKYNPIAQASLDHARMRYNRAKSPAEEASIRSEIAALLGGKKPEETEPSPIAPVRSRLQRPIKRPLSRIARRTKIQNRAPKEYYTGRLGGPVNNGAWARRERLGRY